MLTELADGDTMHAGGDEHYVAVGLSALDCIGAALRGRTPRAILDLPCGFGRVTRMLRARYPAADITVCDVDRPGVDFTAERFDAHPIYSVLDLGALRLPSTYDLIWVGSLVTHLSEAQSRAFLASMVRCLTQDGVLVVTSHGPTIIPGLNGWGYGLEPSGIVRVIEGYKHAGFGHCGYGNDDGYGISLTDQAWWRHAAPECGLHLVSYGTRRWDSHQDVVTLRRSTPLSRLLTRATGVLSRRGEDHVVRNRAAVAVCDLALARFDAEYYLATYPDVAQALQAGIYTSAYDHYRKYGAAEGRSVGPASI